MLNQLTEPLIPDRDSSLSFSYPQKEFSSLRFDYEIDNVLFSSNDDRIPKENSFPDELVPKYYKCEEISLCSKKILKAIISKQKIRMQKNSFDLDLVYITKRMIAMGYPSTGCESLIRNSLSEVKQFLYQEHGADFKVYNLCLEPHRIYNKKIFDGAEVALFPFEDHQSCPVKLMLEFCVDACLYLLDNPNHVCAVHCKAGKGRTGIMVCGYLLFTGIAKNSTQAFEFYGVRRSKDNIGITVASQKRYVHHFETYLSCNFERPYYKLIPKIIEKYLTPPNGNLLGHVFTDKGYYNHNNLFKIKKIKIGPFEKKTFINCQILNFKSQSKFNTGDKDERLNFKNIYKEEHEPSSNKNLYYFIIEITDDLFIDSDINIKIYGAISFNAWVNLFYITLENFIYLVNTQFKDKTFDTGESTVISTTKKKFTQRKKNTSTFSLYKKDPSRDFSFMEMNDLSSLTTQNNQIKQKISENVLPKERSDSKKKLFIRSYDANFFWEKNITLDETKIKNFLKSHTKYKGDHIHSYDLNNIYDYMNKENSYLFDSKRKKFKIKMDSQGLDNFSLKNEVTSNFLIELTYYLDK